MVRDFRVDFLFKDWRLKVLRMELRSSAVRRLLEHWTALKGARAYPERRDFDPINVPSALRDLALVKTATKLEDFEFRVWGSGLTSTFGEDRTGKKFGDLRYIENWQAVFQDYRRVADTGQMILFHDRTVSSVKHFRRYERLMLPLGSTGTGITHILAGFGFYNELS